MAWVRELLISDPALPRETRDAIARGDDEQARAGLLALGVDRCEAQALLGYECFEENRF